MRLRRGQGRIKICCNSGAAAGSFAVLKVEGDTTCAGRVLDAIGMSKHSIDRLANSSGRGPDSFPYVAVTAWIRRLNESFLLPQQMQAALISAIRRLNQ